MYSGESAYARFTDFTLAIGAQSGRSESNRLIQGSGPQMLKTIVTSRDFKDAPDGIEPSSPGSKPGIIRPIYERAICGCYNGIEPSPPSSQDGMQRDFNLNHYNNNTM